MLSDLIAHGHQVRSLALAKGRVGLHCMPISAGFEKRFNEAYSWDGLKRGTEPFLVIQHTLAGRGQLDFAGARHVLGPGDTMLLSFPHANRYWLARGDAWEYFWLLLNGREALRIARAILDGIGPVVRLPASGVDRLAGACLMLVAQPEPTPGEASGAAYGAMMALQDGAFGRDEPVAEPLPPAIARTQHYIEAHLADALDVERLARLAQMSRAHFVRQFTAATGEPPAPYVFGRRMEKAARLLMATDSPVQAVALACGFADANYFAKAFRRAHGLSPSGFRAAGASMLPHRAAE